jgi:exosortase/archaeosortase family protein
MHDISSPPYPFTLAKIWTGFVVLSLGIALIVQKSTYFELDAFGVWVLSCLAILYLSRKPMEYLSDTSRKGVILLGVCIALFSFISIPIGFTHPPYSIGEFAILLSGLGLIVFGIYGFRSLLLPVALPFIAVAGYSGYELFLRNQDWLTAPLVPVTTGITVGLLNLIGISTTSQSNVFTFLSKSGEPIGLTIVSDCTGIMSLGTFTIAVFIVLFSFPSAFSKKGLLWIIGGYFGTYCVNILRIILISLSGYYFGPSGVIEHVHVNIGWIVFSLWMIIYWYFFFTKVLNIKFFKKHPKTGDSP